MDEQPQQPEVVSAATTKTLDEQQATPKPESKVDINRPFLPAAIVIAGLMIGGAIVYTNFVKSGNQLPANLASALSEDNFKKWAKDLGLNTKQFNSCFAAQEFKSEVEKDVADGAANKVSGTPTFFINGTQIVGAVPFANFKTAIETALANPKKQGQFTVSIDDDPVLGNADAPVTIVEFSDFQCPFCLRFWKETFSQIKSEYIDTGKVRFVYRDFPLTSIHPGAMPASLAAQCAHAQGKFWEYSDKIFQAQL